MILITSDVETTSLINHCLRDKTADYVEKQGMPRLLDLFDKHDIKTTFFITGYIAELKPEMVKMAYDRGHEIASHGYSHKVEDAFDNLDFETQKVHLKKSKDILENIIGDEVISFRAPAARVNETMTRALLETGFLIDSSVSSQRMDMMFSFGAMKKMNWLSAPRLPYFTAENNIFKKGNSELLEIPISAFGLPYIGTFMRIAPPLFRMTRNLLYQEQKLNQKPINLLIHPNEFIDEEREVEAIEKRGKNMVSYLLGDVLRHRLKTKNLGEIGLPLLENELEFFKSKQMNFSTCKEYYANVINQIENV